MSLITLKLLRVMWLCKVILGFINRLNVALDITRGCVFIRLRYGKDRDTGRGCIKRAVGST